MNIGATIRKYRRERDITQERFAEYLNISPQAVSRWETGAAYPDITTIPAIATFLGISADVLFGIEESRREEQIQAYLREYKRLQPTGKQAKRFELSKAAKNAFPGDFRVLRNYAEELAASPYQGLDGECVMSDEELKACFDEVLDICQLVREDCTDDEIRNSMVSLELMIYRTIDDEPSLKKAVEIAGRLPDHFQSKDSELATIYDYNTEEEILFHQNYTQKLMISLWWELRCVVYFSQRPPEQRIAACQKALELYRLMYDDGDYGCDDTVVAQVYDHLARLYIEAGDNESALDALEESVRHDLAGCAAMSNGFRHTSPLFDHLVFEKDNYVKNFEETPEERILHRLNYSYYDGIRSTTRFQELIRKLQDAE